MPTAETESPAQTAESAPASRPPREKDRVDSFARRHIGPNQQARAAMLAELEFENLDALIDATVPKNIRLDHPLNLPEAKSEWDALADLRQLAKKNIVARSFIGAGYSDTITPPVIQRNILENPGWYTAYTPYQAEIAQGRLEALLNFQTMITDLTALEIANASLLDEGTAAAEAMALCHAAVSRPKDVLRRGQLPSANDRGRANAREAARHQSRSWKILRASNSTKPFLARFVQYPATDGAISITNGFAKAAHDAGALLVVAADILALTLLKPPGEFGADVAVGSTQRFGVPLGFGGPHAAYFATRDAYKRHMPGRLVGVSHDATGRPGLPARFANARTTHPPRQGDEQHLHSPSPPRRDRFDVRGLSRAARLAGHRQCECTKWRNILPASAIGQRIYDRSSESFSTPWVSSSEPGRSR